MRLEQHHEFLEEFTLRELALPRRIVNTDHVPVFFHVMSNLEEAGFRHRDIEALGGEADLLRYRGRLRILLPPPSGDDRHCRRRAWRANASTSLSSADLRWPLPPPTSP